MRVDHVARAREFTGGRWIREEGMEVMKASTIAIAIMLALLVGANPSEGQVLLDEPVARLGKGTVGDIAYSPDGRLFAVAGSAGIWLYDAKSLIELELLQGNIGEVTSIAFSPDGRMIASASRGVFSEQEGRWIFDGTIRLWDTMEKIEIATLEGHAGAVTSVAFSPDGKTLASAGGMVYSEEGRLVVDGTIRLWDTIQKSEIAVLEGHTAAATSVAFSPDGRTLASAGGKEYSEQERIWIVDGTIRLWDTIEKSGIAILEGHTAAATSVVFSPDGKILASAGEDSTVRLWDADGQKEMAVLSHEDEELPSIVQSVAFSPDGKILAAAETQTWGGMVIRGFGTVRLWDMESRSEIAELGPTPVGGWSGDGAWAVFSPDGKTLAWANGYDTAVHFWDIAGQEETGVIPGYIGRAQPVAFSPDGRTLASIEPGNIRFWNVAEEKEIGVKRTEYVCFHAFSPDGKTFAVLDGFVLGTRDNQFWLSLWDVETQTEIASWPVGGYGWLEYVPYEFSPDRNMIVWSFVTAYMDEVYYGTQLLNFTERKKIGILVDGVPIAFSPDGKTLVLSGDTSIYLWDIENGLEIAEFDVGESPYGVSISPPGHRVTVFSPDWRYLLAAGQQADVWQVHEVLIHLLDLKAKEEVGVLEIPLPGEDPYLHDFNMAVSPDWRYLAAAVMLRLDGRPGQCLVYLRDLETRQEIAVFEGDPGNHVEPAFSPDGRILASKVRSEGDWIVRMWDIETKEEIEFWDPSDFLWLGPEVAGTGFPQGWESIDFSPDGRTLVLEGAEALSLWDIERKEMVAVLEDARGPVAFSSDGRLLASGSGSGIILVWDISPWTELTPAMVESAGKKALVWGELKSAQGEEAVEQAKLWQNYPNPFNPETWIPFELSQESEVMLRIYDAKGSLIREMSLGRKPAGLYLQRSKAIHWDGRNDSGERVASGVYFYTLQAGDYTETRKMILAE